MYPWQKRANRRRRMQRARRAALAALYAILGRSVYGFLDASAPASQTSVAGVEKATWSTMPGWHNTYVDLSLEVAFDREKRDAWLRAAETASHPSTHTVGGLSRRGSGDGWTQEPDGTWTNARGDIMVDDFATLTPDEKAMLRQAPIYKRMRDIVNRFYREHGLPEPYATPKEP